MSIPSTASKTPSTPHPADVTPSRRRYHIVMLTAVVAAALAIGLTVWSMVPGGKPRLNQDTASLARFVASEEYAKLPFDKQQLYMKVIEDREDNGDLKRAFAARQLSESEYRTAKLEAWLGEQLKRSEKYAGLPPGPARTKYISELLNRKAKAESQEKKSSRDNDDDSIKRDDTAEKTRIAALPPDVRAQWEDFRRAYREQKEARDNAAATTTEPQLP